MSNEDLAALIGALADTQACSRENAARAVFLRGAQLVAPVLAEWMRDPELAERFSALAGAAAAPPVSSAAEALSETGRGQVARVQITVGAAVELERFDDIRAANGMPPLADVPPDQDAKEFELDFAGGIRLDILTSRDPGGAGAVARFLRKFGEGIQQVEIKVKDVDRATEILKERFHLSPIYPAARAGANQTRVNFFLVPIEGGKLLIELVS